jgi:hypothetical protein
MPAIESTVMPPVKIDPMKLPGPWADGYVLERQHTLTSDFVGHDSFGNPQFDTKRSELGELKNVFDYQERLTLLQGAFEVDGNAVAGRCILLVDDLYRSGATATVVAQALLSGNAAAVHMLAMTKTRTRT